MAETKKDTQPQNVGRLLDYRFKNYSEKITSFHRRISEQIDILDIAIEEDATKVEEDRILNDSKKARFFAKKAQRFLNTYFFTDKDYKEKRVQNLKDDLKVNVFAYKILASILEARIISKRSHKIILAQKYSSAKGNKEKFNYCYEYQRFFETDLEYLNNIKPNYDSQLILVNKLKGILADKEFLKLFGFKNSWKVSTLKKEISTWVKDHSLEAEYELEEIFSLHFFKHKKYMDMTVSEFKEAVDTYCRGLIAVIDWIGTQINEDESLIDSIRAYGWKVCALPISEMYKVYDDFLKKCSSVKKTIDDMYDLYRFGQGLIEADIFDSLYK